MQTSGNMSGNGISVIIVNYGTADLTIEAVESVLARLHGGRAVEVHVVDNASPGDDAARLAEAHGTRGWSDRVTLWPETENHGFGRGNNVVLTALAARATPPEYVFLLNPDAQLENEAIDILAGALDAEPDAGAAGAGIRNPDGRAAEACFRFPSLQSEIVSAINFGPVDRLFPRGRVALPADRPEGAVDWVAGAAVLMRFGMLKDAGFFDPDFFLYFEEVELMHRLAKRGHRTLYVPAAQVVHAEGAATQVRSGSARRARPAYVYDSWRLYFLKTRGRAGALGIALAKFVAVAAGNTLAMLRGHTPKHAERFLRDHWRHVIRPLATGQASK